MATRQEQLHTIENAEETTSRAQQPSDREIVISSTQRPQYPQMRWSDLRSAWNYYERTER
jgi:hypothetical protein